MTELNHQSILTTICIPTKSPCVFPLNSVSIEMDRKELVPACKSAFRHAKPLFCTAMLPDREAVRTPSDLYDNGCLASIEQIIVRPDGTLQLLLRGVCRAHALRYLKKGEGSFYATVFSIAEEPARDPAAELALIREVQSIYARYTRALPSRPSAELQAAVDALEQSGPLADFIAMHILQNPEQKQKIIDATDPFERLRTVASLLLGDTEILELQKNIHKRVKEQVERSQKEFFLREQLRVIQNELGRGGAAEEEEDGEFYEDADDIGEYQSRIEAIAPFAPEEVTAKLQKELRRLSKMPFGSAESSVLRNYLDICLDYPFGKQTQDCVDVAAARKILDRDHDGLEKVKKRILEYLAVKAKSPQLDSQILCLVGPPGVGKSSIATSVAQAMNRKFVRVALGGIRDEADIRGHRKTYVGSMPGRIVSAVTQSGVTNPLILLDELDKLTRDAHGDPASALLEVLDPEQNRTFRDHFMEIPLDLSDCVFFATANTLETIPAPLLDRVEIIELSSYSKDEKCKILRHHLLPKQLLRHGLDKTAVHMTDGAVLTLIEKYTRESGVRNLERELASLLRKCVMEMEQTGVKEIRLTPKKVTQLLGRPKVLQDGISTLDEVGEVNGLAWTESGGDMLKIEALSLPGSGKIELTGSLGDVMKESARAAFSYVRAHAEEYGIAPDFAQKKDVHIHVPEGAIPKDGPSAGVTMITALVSELSGRPVRRDIAMTGEITLRGHVLPIGGLREKTMAAVRAGVRVVYFPEKNLPDLDELDPAVRAVLRLIPVKTVDQILTEVLLPKPDQKPKKRHAAPVLAKKAAESIRADAANR